ncbi:hypothetical protein BDY17DRAFT_307849 [Neohortaea acidophila]|uniref:Uncharacterized protein n=1 Tax=Neohortaea acidophila TaxID=245834 RepID=A0A6A6Q2Y4_9PEZI|nr:uncharacterized protein BDY17DRAFT_307849 [Neohortaea acidophila]KAF2486354.1 hypothetical protein BDY17DRAFT_307849 [Neohortaea acidophila]
MQFTSLFLAALSATAAMALPEPEAKKSPKVHTPYEISATYTNPLAIPPVVELYTCTSLVAGAKKYSKVASKAAHCKTSIAKTNVASAYVCNSSNSLTQFLQDLESGPGTFTCVSTTSGGGGLPL